MHLRFQRFYCMLHHTSYAQHTSIHAYHTYALYSYTPMYTNHQHTIPHVYQILTHDSYIRPYILDFPFFENGKFRKWQLSKTTVFYVYKKIIVFGFWGSTGCHRDTKETVQPLRCCGACRWASSTTFAIIIKNNHSPKTTEPKYWTNVGQLTHIFTHRCTLNGVWRTDVWERTFAARAVCNNGQNKTNNNDRQTLHNTLQTPRPRP